MYIVAHDGLDMQQHRRRLQALFDRLAHDPHGALPFPIGAGFAVASLGYDPAELADLPEAATARFAGVGNPLQLGPVHRGETVLDHACGAGTDLLLAARRLGPAGRAIGVDMTPAMRGCAVAAADLAGLSDMVDIRAGFMESLPVEDASVDVVLSNGALSLSPHTHRVLREVRRVLKPGGRLYLADTLDVGDLRALAGAAGLRDGRVGTRFESRIDILRSTGSTYAVNFYARA